MLAEAVLLAHCWGKLLLDLQDCAIMSLRHGNVFFVEFLELLFCGNSSREIVGMGWQSSFHQVY